MVSAVALGGESHESAYSQRGETVTCFLTTISSPTTAPVYQAESFFPSFDNHKYGTGCSQGDDLHFL